MLEHSEKNVNSEKNYEYSDAIALTGNGRYNYGLLVTLSLTLLSMCIDMFSFSMIVAFSACDFQLDLAQKSLLVSMPFIGPVIMAYAWGYISDTQGRKKSLLIAMSVSFLMAMLCVFSPNWIVMAILKLIGTCFCSCAQSASYTLLGESCPERVKGTYMIIMTSVVHLGSVTYFTLGYFMSNMSFEYDLGFVTFVPWRLMALILAMPLGLSSLCLCFFYESPKFLLNGDREEEALVILKEIYRRNGGEIQNYPVEKMVLHEEGNITRKVDNLLESMWEQTAPLFKPPLLANTLLLYYLIFTMYSSNSALYIWLPFIAKAFTASAHSSIDADQAQGLCNMITLTSNSTSESVSCEAKIDAPMAIAAASYGCCVSLLNVLLSGLASRKKALIIAIFSFSSISCLATTVIKSNASSFLYFGILTNSIGMGPISSYYVDLYPTSFRGMAACLGVMMARISSVIGINLVGPFIMTHCSTTFYSVFALILSGVMMANFLPQDRRKSVKTEPVKS